jgi:ketosteroid isomerase-like protein
MSSQTVEPPSAKNPTVTGVISVPPPPQTPSADAGDIMRSEATGGAPSSRSTASVTAAERESGTSTGTGSADATPPKTASETPPAPAARTPESDRAALNELLASWVRAWEEKDLDAYFACYAEGFRFPDRDMGRSAFVRYRTRLIREAGEIDVELEGPEIKLNGDKARVTFVQRYRSDGYSDSGTKTLNLVWEKGSWKIASESFRAAGGRG